MFKLSGYLIFITALIFSIILLFLFKFRLFPFSNSSKVIRVIDGDTVVLNDGKRVRLLGIDAPEFGNCLGPQAQKELESLVLFKSVRLVENRGDNYNRQMASIFIGDIYINKVMVTNGLARLDYSESKYRDDLKIAYQEAKNNMVGIHSSLCLGITPADPKCVIKGNIDAASGHKFYHYPGCSHYRESRLNLAYGDKWFCSSDDARKAGFSLASGCP